MASGTWQYRIRQIKKAAGRNSGRLFEVIVNAYMVIDNLWEYTAVKQLCFTVMFAFLCLCILCIGDVLNCFNHTVGIQ